MNESRERIEQLLEQFGSPLYVFDEQGFINNYHKLYAAMSSYYDNYRIAYSFKTNYTPYICLTGKRFGSYAEVVSDMEYNLARQIGYKDCEIIFNGPNKGKEGVEACLRGCKVNVDSLDEMLSFCRAAENNPVCVYKIGLRVNLDIGQGFVSRFGMDEQDLEKAFQMAEKIPNLKISGLHCHISRCRGKEAWRKRTEYMLGLTDRFFGSPPEYIDLGSGMFGSMAPELASQFENIPSYEEYAEVTAGIVAEHYKGKKGPLLFTEPGTTLVNRFVVCVARVECIKTIRGHHFAVLNASEHILGETCTLKRLPVRVVSGDLPQTYYSSIDLTGYTCLEQDVLLPAFEGKLAKGDYVVFENTGGYSNVLKPPFIRPGCAMVAMTEAGDCKLIKKAESFEDVFRTYVLEDNT